MPQIAERACIALLAVYLIWLPLPFGSIIDAAFVPLILPPILICALAACLRSRMPPNTSLHMSLAYRIWTAGAVALVIIVALQLVPLPQSLLALASPMSQRIWSSADRVASLAHIAASAHPISIAPETTWRELLRLVALFATMQASAILINTN